MKIKKFIFRISLLILAGSATFYYRLHQNELMIVSVYCKRIVSDPSDVIFLYNNNCINWSEAIFEFIFSLLICILIYILFKLGALLIKGDFK